MSDKDRLQRYKELIAQYDHLVIHDSTIIIGSSGSFAVENKHGSTLSESEKELMRLYKKLPMRDKVELIRLLYEVEDRLDAEGKLEKGKR